MSDLEYWFDTKKESNLNSIKNEFKQMMYQNGKLTDSGEKVFDAIWGNQSLRESLFGENMPNTPEVKKSSKKKISQWIENLDTIFFKFIKMK